MAKNSKNLWNVNRKDIYFIWLRFKNRKAESKQRVKVSLAKYFGIFYHDISYNMRFFSQTENHVFLEFQRIKTFQTIHQGV